MKIRTFFGAFILSIGLLGVAWAQEDMQSITQPRQIFEKGYIQVVGSSEAGQSRYRAIRAAEVVAQRDLLEVVQGLKLYGTTSVKDGMLQSDAINTSVEGFLRGAMKYGEHYDPKQGYADVTMRLYIRGQGGLYDIILPLMKENQLMPEKKPDFKPSMPALVPEVMSPQPAGRQTSVTSPTGSVNTKTASAKGAGNIQKPEVKAPSKLATPYDGLIVDARDFQFRPALVNRILTVKDQVVFDPSKIQSNVLVDRGCGGFTTTDGKAKALLDSWGSKHPLIIKCVGVSQHTDAEVSQDDAAAIYVNNQKSNLLAQARVVFVLK